MSRGQWPGEPKMHLRGKGTRTLCGIPVRRHRLAHKLAWTTCKRCRACKGAR